jgi:hypothetical protein
VARDESSTEVGVGAGEEVGEKNMEDDKGSSSLCVESV